MERVMSVFAVLVIMAATQLTVNAETQFFDDFEDGLDNWNILSGNVTIVEDDTAEGNNVMDFNGAGQSIIAADDAFRDLTDCVIEVRGRAVEQLQWTEVVILFRVQGDNVNYYQAYTNVHSTDTNTVLNNGAFVNFNTVQNIPVVVGEWFTKRVRIEGEHIQVFIDDELYIDEERNDLDSGTFGSRSATVHVQYDDWHVYDLDGPSEKPGAVSKDGKLAVAWGTIKSQ